MKRTTLGRTGIEVSEYCLGTMTFSTNTSEQDSHRQLDMSLDFGIDFWIRRRCRSAVRKETVGVTEEIIGRWIAKSGRRNDYVIATKYAGENAILCVKVNL